MKHYARIILWQSHTWHFSNCAFWCENHKFRVLSCSTSSCTYLISILYSRWTMFKSNFVNNCTFWQAISQIKQSKPIMTYIYILMSIFINIDNAVQVKRKPITSVTGRPIQKFWTFLINALWPFFSVNHGTPRTAKYTGQFKSRMTAHGHTYVGSLARFRKRHTFSMEPFSSKSCLKNLAISMFT